MEVKSLNSDCDDNCIEEAHTEKLSSEDSPDSRDIFADPLVSPRVGDDYQVEIPPMKTEAERFQLLVNPMESGGIIDVSHLFLTESSVPIMWIRLNHDERSKVEDEGKVFLSALKNDAVSSKRPIENGKVKNHVKLKKKRSGLSAALNALQHIRGNCAVPGHLNKLWDESEVQSFILGLYIFGKNFVQVKRFIENKEMGDILSFYYGIFYRSDAYRRWAAGRKIGSRKCIIGRKIFMGWRQQQILSRLAPHVPEELQKNLLEASMSFSDGKTLLEEYISSLKSIVGIQNLVKAIGIGKGKEDLTVFSPDPGKNSQMCPISLKVPSGKACSSLTCNEIVKFLTGGFRLSKARCNDIFWEAVWPRLLARGWHSEQPKNQGYISSRDSLVFLMPGVENFLRRELVKGEHYFNSVSDVLNKVASEPELLKLETEAATFSEITSDPDDKSDNQRHSYLKPRVSTTNHNYTKFTIVDTSSVHSGKSSSMKELRYLPVEFKIRAKSISHFEGTDRSMFKNLRDEYKKHKHRSGNDGLKGMKFTVVDTSLVRDGKLFTLRELRCSSVKIRSDLELNDHLKDKEHEHDAADMCRNDEKKIVDVELDKRIGNADHRKEKVVIENSDTENIVVESPQVQRTIKHQFSRRVKSSDTGFTDPLIKRRRLSACVKTEINHIIEHEILESKQGGTNLSFTLPTTTGSSVVSQTCPQLKELYIASLTDASSKEEKGLEILPENCFCVDKSNEKKDKDRSQSSIDLNVPQISLDSKHGEKFAADMVKNESGSCFPSNSNELDSEELKTSIDASTSENDSIMNSRRQSVRNRPLTIRALEAFANELLYVPRKRKREEACSNDKNPFTSHSRKSRSKVRVGSHRGTAGAGILQLKEEKEGGEKPRT